MKLVIAEKPSVAISIAKVIGATKRKEGYVEGNGYIVSWCVGHLVQMSSPEKYDKRYKYWKLADLPIIPTDYQYEVSKYTKKQFSVLKKLLADKRVTEVVNACDAGREGELIFRLVYNQAKCKKAIKRLWISSLEDKAISDGFNQLKDGRKYENLYQSALVRGKADWLIGMNLSRYYSCKNNNNYSVGRVQTPTVAMIVERDKAIREFKKEKYYTVSFEANDITFTTNRIEDSKIAEDVLSYINEKTYISYVKKERKHTKPSKLFDLTTLQRSCNKYFGLSAKETLDIAQKLYEKKLVTYPRTDSCYLTDDMMQYIQNYTYALMVKTNPNNMKRIFNSSKVSDHHAIIPTTESLKYDITKLSDNDQKVFNVIKNQLLAAVSDDLITDNSVLTVTIKGYDFSVKGKQLVDPGCSVYLQDYLTQKEDVLLPPLQKGDSIDITHKEINEKYTKPPQHYTEDSLLKAMETAGKEDLVKGVEIERNGLGTPATRASIIEIILKKQLVKRDKKYLVATNKGSALIELVADFLKSPKMTAEWEMKLADIAKGKYLAKDFEQEIIDSINQVLQEQERGQ